MSEYYVQEIRRGDEHRQAQMDALLAREGIRRDAHLDYSVGIYDAHGALLATGSAYRGTLRSIAVDAAHRGEGLLSQLITALTQRQVQRGYTEVFLYTKPETMPLFGDLGFCEIARVEGRLVFMSNRAQAFERYVDALGAPLMGRAAAVVVNANPFTLGHLHLIQHAARENDGVHVFVVSEDVSLVPADVRMQLVRAGTAQLSNVRVHPAGNYMVSSATFPAYFLKDEYEVTRTQAELDVCVFARIAQALKIARRYAGEEPFSQITRIYNAVMQSSLPNMGVEFIEIPRVQAGGRGISASYVRRLLQGGSLEAIRPYVPETTYAYFASDAAQSVLEAIRAQARVEHD